MLAQLKDAVEPLDDQNARRERLGLVSKMLLTYPIAGASAESGRARGEAYGQALDDVPPWAVAEAIRLWHRGECGEGYDYRWAPSPADLRKIARSLLIPLREAAAHVQGLLNAMSLEEAMGLGEQTPEQREYVAAGFKKLAVDLDGIAKRDSKAA